MLPCCCSAAGVALAMPKFNALAGWRRRYGVAGNADEAWESNGGGKFTFKIDKKGALACSPLPCGVSAIRA